MESSIAGLLILSVLIVAVVLMSQAYVVSNTLLGTAIVESVNLAAERSRTELSIDSVAANQDTLTITATNTGSVPIADYDKMDVFVGSKRLVYATSTPVVDQWTINGDSIWRPEDTRRIVAYVKNVGATTTVVVSSPAGASKPTALSTPTPTPTPIPTSVTLPCNSYTISTTTTSTVVACTTR